MSARAMTPALAVPELAPSLGRLIVPRPIAPAWTPLDDVREALATDVMTLGGAGRKAAAEDDARGLVAALAPPAWQRAWERAVRRAAERVAVVIEGEIDRAAWRVRMPRRVRTKHALTGAERRAVAVRLALGGETLTPALAALERAGERLAAAESDPTALADWQDAVRHAARRVEAAWLALEAAVEEERERWAPEIAAIGAWRPARWPVVAAWLPIAAVVIWLGLVLGGYLPAPAWLADFLGF